jgi:hypothetical protein
MLRAVYLHKHMTHPVIQFTFRIYGIITKFDNILESDFHNAKFYSTEIMLRVYLNIWHQQD